MPTVTTYPGVFGPYTPITFTRASTATYFNSAGTLTSAAINEARLDYNPSTLVAQGVLIEEARTNVCLQSAALNTTPWSVVVGNASINANTTIAPDGTTTGDSLIPDTTPAVSHLITQAAIGGLDRATQRVISVFVKLAGYQGIRIQDNAFSANFTRGLFNLSTLTASTVQNGNGVASNATITNVGNGWYRCSYVSTPNTVTGGGSDLTIAVIDTGTNDIFAGDGTSGVVLWGCQVETGAFPTSYIPTTTTALTRSADVASVNTLSPWFNATEGGLYVEWQSNPTAYARYLVSIEQAAASTTRIDININAGNTVNPRTVVSGAAVASLSGGTYAAGTIAKVAFGYKSADYASSLNGAAAVTATTAGVLPSSLATMYLGSITGGTPVNGWLRRFTYYPRRLSNAELQTITT